MIDSQTDPGWAKGGKVVVAMDVGPGTAKIARAGHALAEALNCGWEVIHIETPTNAGDHEAAAEALGFAASLGATVAKLPAATVAAGLASYLETASAGHLVLGQSRRSRRLFHQHSLLEDIADLGLGLIVHVIPTGEKSAPSKSRLVEHGSPVHYAYALAAAMMTVGLALVLRRAAGIQYLSFLFFFPVIASAARLGIRPAVAAAIGCSAAFNFFFLEPAHVLKLTAFQSWIMTAALVLVALYTGAVTATLRARAVLSERSAQENASIAGFVADLTRAADWETTARVICSGTGALLDVDSVLVREIDGTLVTIASKPVGIGLEPLDMTALEWAWSHGVPAGSGTTAVSAGNWRFEPLITSLGTLAVLGLARPDGRDPVPAVRKLLLSTLIAQSALALERLRLEDMMQREATRSELAKRLPRP